MSSIKEVLTQPLLTNNPIAVQILGVCSALAVTTSYCSDDHYCLLGNRSGSIFEGLRL